MKTLATHWLINLKQTTGHRQAVVCRAVASLAFLCAAAQAAVAMPATWQLAGGEPPIVVDRGTRPGTPSRSALALMRPSCLAIPTKDVNESSLTDRWPTCTELRADVVNPQPLPPRGRDARVAVNPQPLPPIHDRGDAPSARRIAASGGYIGETEKRFS